ncbi:MAG: DUF6713 family protein, partial [Deltaproteobacteria bacterium]
MHTRQPVVPRSLHTLRGRGLDARGHGERSAHESLGLTHPLTFLAGGSGRRPFLSVRPAWALTRRCHVLSDPGQHRPMTGATTRLYLLQLALLATHQVDAAYWHEWDVFGVPGGLTFFLVFNLAAMT